MLFLNGTPLAPYAVRSIVTVGRETPLARIKTASAIALLASFVGLVPAVVQARDNNRRDR